MSQINKKLTSKSIMSVVSGITYIHIARVSFFCRDLDARVPQSTLRAQTIAVFVSLAMHLCVLAGITQAGYQIKSTYWKCNFPMAPNVRWSVGRFVCWFILKGQEVL